MAFAMRLRLISVNRMVTFTQSSTSLRSKLLRLEQELNQIFLERQEFVRVIILSLLTRQHALVFGKHGAAKSALIRAAASAFTGGYFGIQLGKDTTRDEVFGPIKVSQLSNDKLCRAYENFLPGKHFVFLDEIDKGNSIIINALYTAMEERLFLDDGTMRPMPLISLFGAANNISLFQTDALAPLLDRFLFRIEVDWIQADANFLEFIRRKAEQDAPVLTTSLSLQELSALHLQIAQVQFPRDVQEVLCKLRKDLANESIYASDRRWGYIVDLLKAIAFLSGDSFISEEHFLPLRHVLWTNKNQLLVIDRLLKALDQGLPQQVKQLLNSIDAKVMKVLQDCNPQTLLGEATLVVSDLQALRNRLSKLTSNSKVKTCLTNIQKMQQQVELHRDNICNV